MISFNNLGKQGRVGNQMYQISATISLAKEHNDKFIFPDWQYKEYFNLDNCFGQFKAEKEYNEPHFHYKQIPYHNSLDLVGFFQSPKYFEKHEDYIKYVFSFSFPVRPNEVTSIHVRRTDYTKLGNDYYIDLYKDKYYDRAMETINARNYWIFSDELDYCKEIFTGNMFTFVEETDPVMALALMSSCENNIIANSSFSWWAAYLNKNADKKVIAPNKWFGKKLNHDTKDLLPESWCKL